MSHHTKKNRHNSNSSINNKNYNTSSNLIGSRAWVQNNNKIYDSVRVREGERAAVVVVVAGVVVVVAGVVVVAVVVVVVVVAVVVTLQ